MVPEWEERESARFSLIPWHEWRALEYDEKVGLVAYYRVHNMVEAHASYAVQRRAELSNR